jgi:hypothetical protein
MASGLIQSADFEDGCTLMRAIMIHRLRRTTQIGARDEPKRQTAKNERSQNNKLETLVLKKRNRRYVVRQNADHLIIGFDSRVGCGLLAAPKSQDS